MDILDQNIIENLDEDARMSLKELSARVGLSSPSVAERLRRLQQDGVIRAFTLDVDPEALGYILQAMVRVRPLPGKLHIVEKLLKEIPEISEVDKVTGEDCFICRMHVRSMTAFDMILDRVGTMAETNTSIVKSQPVKRRLPALS
jgi:Lrp/AsnC family leucine-responsive transcriptional regulator